MFLLYKLLVDISLSVKLTRLASDFEIKFFYSILLEYFDENLQFTFKENQLAMNQNINDMQFSV